MIDPAEDRVAFDPMYARAHPLAREEADRLACLLGIDPSGGFRAALHVAVSLYVEEVFATAKFGSHNAVGARTLAEFATGERTLASVEDGPASAWLVGLKAAYTATNSTEASTSDFDEMERRMSRLRSLADGASARLRPRRGRQINRPRRGLAAALADIAAACDAPLGLGSKVTSDWPREGLMPFARDAFKVAADVGLVVLQQRPMVVGDERAEVIAEFCAVRAIGSEATRQLLSGVRKGG